MLGRAWEAARLWRIKRPLYHAFKVDRLISTSGVGLLPRGTTRNEKKSERHERDNVDHFQESNLAMEEKNSIYHQDTGLKTHRDMRSIDQVDPIILKYTNVLSDLRAAKNVPEKVYETNFGSIRFDNENIPKVHGQYDMTEELDTGIPKKKHGIEDIVISQSVDDNGREYPKGTLDFQNASSLSEQVALRNSNNYAKSVDMSFQVNDLERQRSESQSNYIDELVFSKAEEDFQKLNMKERELTASKKPQVRGDDLNFVDNIYFRDAVENYGSIPQAKTFSKSEIQNDVEMAGESKSVEKTSSELHFIDDIYFKDSLDNITLAEKTNTENRYSIVERDVLKSINSKAATEVETLKSKDDNTENTSLTQKQIMKNAPVGSNKEQIKQVTKNSQTQDRDNTVPKSAYDFVVKLRKEEREKMFEIGEEGTKKNYKKVLSLVDGKRNDKYTKHEILGLLKRSIIYDKYDIIGLYKPFGLTMQGGGGGKHHVLTDFLPELAQHLRTDELHIIHRLDADTTGVLLLARTPAMASTLKKMFKERQVKKTYWGITKGIPKLLHGVIDIPIVEGLVDDRRRMVLCPDVPGFKTPSGNKKQAITEFKVLSKANSTSLIELSPVTGVKHQLRVHLGFGLACPILGDHKYSHLQKLAPQRLPGDTLTCLKIKQSKVRGLPIFLHSRSILLPEIVEGKNIFIKAKLPAFFNKTLSLLKLNKHMNQVKDVDLRNQN
ncbi:uncharacterized protein LOC125043019 [Penaeus chinensis]|uniref:uncharacterized protein LOC125043019 n=1 Tax=Penaeus chinensis TaxID=139456 RepID=UPI001FB640A4|nr:uncharacterized protein LOC125043019 [Penaeus chinensis]